MAAMLQAAACGLDPMQLLADAAGQTTSVPANPFSTAELVAPPRGHAQGRAGAVRLEAERPRAPHDACCGHEAGRRLSPAAAAAAAAAHPLHAADKRHNTQVCTLVVCDLRHPVNGQGVCVRGGGAPQVFVRGPVVCFGVAAAATADAPAVLLLRPVPAPPFPDCCDNARQGSRAARPPGG